MSRSGSPSDTRRQLVGDASMWISLVATGSADRQLRAFGYRAAITDVARDELDRGRPKGRMAASEVEALIHIGLVEVVSIGPADEALFLSFVSGDAAATLDDGEAATLAWAAGHGAVAVIDERKATLVAAMRAPDLELLTTTDLLLAPQTIAALGEPAVASALYAALLQARMRVPPSRIPDVLALIGPERAQNCRSLPAEFRSAGLLYTEGLDAGLSLNAGVES